MSITTIGLLLVQHFHRNKEIRSLTAGGGEHSGQPSPLWRPDKRSGWEPGLPGYMRSSMVSPSSST